ncbi:uncharacterized protein [Typha angustifolia]|uniref:uncharacterized protein n=1 Tax=Typha angustifolia TaxID=59011 RepID=UPI003C2D1D44
MDEKQSFRPLAPTKRGFLDWQLENYEKEMFMAGYAISNRSITDLLQNCDLPPPLKLFTPLDEDEKSTTRQNLQPERPPSKPNKWEDELGLNNGENPSLMRALQLSQTRAREAERKVSLASVRNHQMAALLLEESLRLTAHRQWVRMLEAETSMLRDKLLYQQKEEQTEEEEAAAALPAAATWYLALALCLGIAGVGFALGRCMV